MAANFLDYYVKNTCDRQVDKQLHHNIEAYKVKIEKIMLMNKEKLIINYLILRR